MKFKSEYDLRLQRCWENLDETTRLNSIYKPQRVQNQSMFTAMGTEDYHRRGKLVQERESFEEQRDRVSKMVKQERKSL